MQLSEEEWSNEEEDAPANETEDAPEGIAEDGVDNEDTDAVDPLKPSAGELFDLAYSSRSPVEKYFHPQSPYRLRSNLLDVLSPDSR